MITKTKYKKIKTYPRKRKKRKKGEDKTPPWLLEFPSS